MRDALIDVCNSSCASLRMIGGQVGFEYTGVKGVVGDRCAGCAGVAAGCEGGGTFSFPLPGTQLANIRSMVGRNL